jgi:hypothetical protein
MSKSYDKMVQDMIARRDAAIKRLNEKLSRRDALLKEAGDEIELCHNTLSGETYDVGHDRVELLARIRAEEEGK